MLPYLSAAALGYFLGSIPFGYILVRALRGEDIRRSGSGNIGATNVSRTSPALGALTLLLDALKGLAAVLLTRWLFPAFPALGAVAALFAVCGHMFPLWLRFRGGKGVATGLGSFLMLAPKAILVTIIVFAAMVLVFRYVSLASITSVTVFPPLAWLLDDGKQTSTSLVCISLASALIVAKHHQNIRRLLSHTEPSFQLRRK